MVEVRFFRCQGDSAETALFACVEEVYRDEGDAENRFRGTSQEEISLSDSFMERPRHR